MGQRAPNCSEHCIYRSHSLSVTINSLPISLKPTALVHIIIRPDSPPQKESSPFCLLHYLSISRSPFPPFHSLCLSVVLPGCRHYKVLRREGLNSPVIWFSSFVSAWLARWKCGHCLHCWDLKSTVTFCVVVKGNGQFTANEF